MTSDNTNPTYALQEHGRLAAHYQQARFWRQLVQLKIHTLYLALYEMESKRIDTGIWCLRRALLNGRALDADPASAQGEALCPSVAFEVGVPQEILSDIYAEV